MAFRAIKFSESFAPTVKFRPSQAIASPWTTRPRFIVFRSYSYCALASGEFEDSKDALTVEPMIGLELHVQLASRNKLFSSAYGPTADLESNTNVALFDAAIPGTQPILSWDCLRLALVASLALQCDIQQKSGFDRKHYFYPDLPAGYQITQHYAPIAKGGKVNIGPKDGSPRTFDVRIKQVQLEQDTAKSYADPLSTNTLIDLNRSGAGLIEIVTEPDIQTAREASVFVRKLQSMLRATGVSRGNMEQGSLRCDVNVSVRARGSTVCGTRSEIKNVNGLGNIEQAITYEVARQSALLNHHDPLASETRGFDPASKTTFRLRSKETVTDYRYMPDTDIPPIVIPPAVVERFRELVPELPSQTVTRVGIQYKLADKICEILLAIGPESIEELADFGIGMRFFEAVMTAAEPGTNSKQVADWIIHDLLGQLTKHQMAFVDSPIAPSELARLVNSVTKGVLPKKLTSLFSWCYLRLHHCEPGPIAREMLSRAVGQEVFTLSKELDNYITSINSNTPENQISPDQLAQELVRDMTREVTLIQRGRHDQIVGKMVGEGMRRSQRRVDPRLLRSALERLLNLSPSSTGHQ
ncbi:hypothetical protein CROQUDRAFT_61414 [Cronartium quercuum f. sp. fusiforme G11]|uniref:Glutamyl-tRNA(Gln) amidotransferase subunit B, mitochondrial n=1 Tax=Cronartium quercuum f. sp. fusiforme G11 TaxID=708437 RepID=A0A9P6NLK2_9BASI|nr:hypothetical protein CROQUDRAFT_61414 [Cronartium quercuum f. sp. fusiforme G11]